MTRSLPKLRLAETPRGRVEYLLDGDSGPLIVGFHGCPGDCFQIRLLLKKLGFSARHCRLLCINRPGYRATPLASGRSMAAQSELVAALIAGESLGPAALAVGFSCGGVPALFFALRHPELTQKLLLLSGVTGAYFMFGRVWSERPASRFVYNAPAMAFGMGMSRILPENAVRGLLGETLSGTEAERKNTASKIMRSRRDKIFFLEMFRQMHDYETLAPGVRNDDRYIRRIRREIFAPLKLPILLLHGGKDADVGLEHAELLHALLPQSELRVFPEAGHLLTYGDARLRQIRATAAAFLKRPAQLA